MSAYILRRLALFVPTLIGVSIVVFVLVRLLPGDATTLQLQDAKSTAADEAALRHQLGLDKPIVVQYVDWVATLARGDLGRSFKSRNPVADELSGRIPVTLELGLMAMVIAAAIAIPIGVLSAARQDTWADYLARSAAIGLLAIPLHAPVRRSSKEPGARDHPGGHPGPRPFWRPDAPHQNPDARGPTSGFRAHRRGQGPG